MPFGIIKRGRHYSVVTNGTGKVHGTHPTHEAAFAQVKAMYANDADKDANGKRQAAPAKPKPSKYFTT